MEEITVLLDKRTLFDNIIHGRDGVRTLPDSGDLTIVTKHGAMESGRAAACLTFTVEVSGKRARARTVVPVRLLLSTLRILQTIYSEDGMPREHT